MTPATAAPAGPGTAQHERRPPLLRDDAIGLDERSLAQLIDSCTRHAALLHTGEPLRGNWAELLAREESIWLARLACLDLATPEAHFMAAFAGHDLHAMQWGLDRLSEAYASCRDGLGAVASADWQARLTAMDKQIAPELARARADGQAARLRLAFFCLRHGLAQLQQQARATLPAALASGRHEPASALLLAGLQQLQIWQAQANRLHGRRLDLYYLELLAQQPRAAHSGLFHLVLQANSPEPTELPTGTRFSAGVDAQGKPLLARAITPLRLSDAEVVAVHTLRRIRDPRTAPEFAFGAVSDLRLATPPVTGLPPDQPGWPLLGADPDTSARRAGEPAPLGLAIASPLLRMAEGWRSIRIRIRMPETPGALDRALSSALAANDRDFPREMGAVLARWLLSADDFDATKLAKAQQRAIGLNLVGAEAQRSAADPLCLLSGQPRPKREAMRRQLLQSPFDAWLSGAAGWWRAETPRLVFEAGALVLTLEVPPSAPPLVPCSPEPHGAEWPAGEVLLRLEIGVRQRMHPLSLLGDLQMTAVDVGVQVRGLRQLEIHNQLGRLDPGKPFTPFGPLPDGASHLIIGAPELTHKPLTSLSLNLQWAGLPETAASLQGLDADTPLMTRLERFRVAAEVLHDGRWQDDEGQVTPELPLFREEDGHLLDIQRLQLPQSLLRRHWRALPVAATHQPYGSGSRIDFLRLRLCGPAPDFFGHARYPHRLTDALSFNARPAWQRGLQRQPLPQSPYTPVLERLTLDYKAHRCIELGAADAGTRPDRVYHRYPLGLVPLQGDDELPGLLPVLDPDGHLLIGLRASQIAGRLSLLFELDGAVERRVRERQRGEHGLTWSVWDQDRWVKLKPTSWLSDGTSGLLASGVTVIELPDFAPAAASGALPASLYWLRLVSDASSSSFGALRSLRAQALTAERESAAEDATLERPRADWRAQPSIAAVGQVTQPLWGLGHTAAESVDAFRTRVAERLRHRGRACQPWDYERLVLAEVPEVERVLCVPAHIAVPGEAPVAPGTVRLYVVPRVPRNVASLAIQPASLPVATLERIEALLRPLASPHAAIRVHSAGFEHIQLRCRLRLKPEASAGQALQAAQALVRRLLSPWFDDSLVNGFGWTLHGSDLARALRELPEVLDASGLSLLHYGVNAFDRHWLADSASQADPEQPLLRPRHPGNLALPAPRHLIEASGGRAAVEASGLRHLTLGQTLIVR